MAIAYNTSIVRDGLVLYLDAANKKSYSGTGTAWNDLSGNGRNTTLINGVGYNSVGMSFDGTNDRVDGSSTASTMGITTDLTISIFTKRSSSPTNVLQGQAGFGTGGSISFKNSTYYFADINTTTPTRYILPITPTGGNMTPYENVWVNLCVTVSGTTAKAYLNGNLVTTQVMDTTIKSFSSEVFGIGGGYGYFSLQGDVSIASVYNRALSDQEIQQNFNAVRGRYNV